MFLIDKLPSYIALGNQGDFGHAIRFDLSAWSSLNADDWKMTYTRPGESATYPVPDGDVAVADDVLTWTIGGAVTAIGGTGSVIIGAYRGGEMLKHSARAMTIIGAGHAPAGEAPDPIADWIDDVNVIIGQISDAEVEREQAEEARERAEGLRKQGETDRDNAYSQAEAARDGLYATAESARDGLFEAAETTRNAPTGDAIDRANTIAETLEGIAPKWAGVDIDVSALPEGAYPTASIAQDETGTSISLGIPKGDTGAQGPVGNVMYATFDIDFDTCELVMTIPDGYTGPTFLINDKTGELEVSI